jgi:hypothetical protein
MDVRGGSAPDYGLSERIIRDSQGLQVLSQPDTFRLIGTYSNIHTTGVIESECPVQAGVPIGADRQGAAELSREGPLYHPKVGRSKASIPAKLLHRAAPV